ncbi:MAG: hypothetical protein EXR79_02775 [Myxococcales bacterium]|nr:hypothetical protein [Myxococcales bacterium]
MSTRPEIIDVDAVRHESPDQAAVKAAQRLVQRLLGEAAASRVEAAVQRIDAARAQARTQFESQVHDARGRIDGLEKKAQDFVATVQTTVQSTVHGAASAAKETVAKEKQDVEKRWEAVVGQLIGRIGDKRGVAGWLDLPDDVRRDLLTAVGVASAEQVAKLQEELAGLRAEMNAQFVALTELAGGLVEAKAKQGATAAVAATAAVEPDKKAKKKPAAAAAAA